MKIVIDMNLGLDWTTLLEGAGFFAVHWSKVGDQDEADEKIMRWARDRSHVVLTADLDFGMRLVRNGEQSPSVVQLRTAETIPSLVGGKVLKAMDQARAAIDEGAVVTVEAERVRIRGLKPSSLLQRPE